MNFFYKGNVFMQSNFNCDGLHLWQMNYYNPVVKHNLFTARLIYKLNDNNKNSEDRFQIQKLFVEKKEEFLNYLANENVLIKNKDIGELIKCLKKLQIPNFLPDFLAAIA